MGYFRDTIKGISWMGGLRAFTRLISFLKIVIIARILSPSQFGVFGIATLVLAFLEILTETGINVFLIQEDEDLKEYVDTSWIVSIFRGFVIFLVLIVSAPLISLFFNSPESLPILLIISLVPLIRGFINPSIVKFQKHLQFAREFWFRGIIFLFDALVAITFAYITKSAVSFVLGMIAGVILEIILSFIFIEPRPRLSFDWPKIKKVLDRGKWLTGAGIFQYLFRQGDDIIVGKILGETLLGFYQMAYRVATLPITEVADVFAKVTFPVFVNINQDKPRLKKAFIKTTLGITGLVIPFGLILILFGYPIVNLALGEKWLYMVPVLKILVVYSIIRAIINPVLTLFLALKKQEYLTAVTFVSIFFMALSIFPLVKLYGISGAGMSTIVGTVFSLPLIIYFSIKVFK